MEMKDIRFFREMMRQMQRNLGWQWKNDAACCGITLAQCHALLELGKSGEIALVELASLLGLDASTLSRTIDGMVLAGLLERRANHQDRRYVKITLTEQGKEVYDRINRTYDDYYSQVFADIPPDKHGQILESMELLVNAIDGLHSDTCRQEGQSR